MSTTVCSKPIIDVKPIQFWSGTTENIQPRRSHGDILKLNLSNINTQLYNLNESEDSEELSDEDNMNKFNLGKLHFGIQYEIQEKCLIIKMIEAKKLPPPVSKDNTKQDIAQSNPYVKIYLSPDEANSQQSKVITKSQNPCFNETFKFDVTISEVQKKTLVIKVKDFDKYSRHTVIGQILLPLADVNIVKGSFMWKPLIPADKVSFEKKL